MGYRTTGKWIIKGPADTIRAMWAAARLEVEPYTPTSDVVDQASFDDFKVYYLKNQNGNETGYIRFEFNDWKWYTSYPSVQFYERVWSYMVAYDADDLQGRRVHVGADGATEDDSIGHGMIDLWTSVEITDEEPDAPEENAVME